MSLAGTAFAAEAKEYSAAVEFFYGQQFIHGGVEQVGRHEIANILDYVFGKENWDISSEELTPEVRDNYTAVLLLRNPKSGVPDAFYSAEGSLGGKSAMNNAGELMWNVESIVNTFFFPATSCFTIGGTCQVFCLYL